MHGANLIKVKILRFRIAQYISRAKYLTGIILLSRKTDFELQQKISETFWQRNFKSGKIFMIFNTFCRALNELIQTQNKAEI